jgi:hypothetical protein
MPSFRLPLSGDVNQNINPWTWFFRNVGNQFGIFNINLGQSSDPELEERILEQVGSYGKQLGQLGDALRVLIEHADVGSFPKKEREVLAAALTQLDHIDVLKRQRKLEKGA